MPRERPDSRKAAAPQRAVERRLGDPQARLDASRQREAELEDTRAALKMRISQLTHVQS